MTLGFWFPCCWLAMPCPGCGRRWLPLCQDTSRPSVQNRMVDQFNGKTKRQHMKWQRENRWQKDHTTNLANYREIERERRWAMSAMVREACSALACSGCISKCRCAFIFRAGASWCLFTIVWGTINSIRLYLVIFRCICIVSVSACIVQCIL